MAGSTIASPIADPAIAGIGRARHVSPGFEAWRRFRRHRLAVASIFALGLMLLAVAAGPYLWQIPINDIDFGARLAAPSWTHPFGTDDLGQDLFARMLYGGRISLAVGLSAMAVAVIVGIVVGSVAGMSRGWVDAGLMWLTDLFLSLPGRTSGKSRSTTSILARGSLRPPGRIPSAPTISARTCSRACFMAAAYLWP